MPFGSDRLVIYPETPLTTRIIGRVDFKGCNLNGINPEYQEMETIKITSSLNRNCMDGSNRCELGRRLKWFCGSLRVPTTLDSPIFNASGPGRMKELAVVESNASTLERPRMMGTSLGTQKRSCNQSRNLRSEPGNKVSWRERESGCLKMPLTGPGMTPNTDFRRYHHATAGKAQSFETAVKSLISPNKTVFYCSASQW